MTGSLARNGDGGMTGQFKADSGSGAAPGISWASETTSGWYRAGTGDFRFSIAGTDVVTITASGVTATWTALSVTGNATIGGTLGVTGATTLGVLTVGTSITLPAASVADAALSSNVPLKSAANTFTAAQSITIGAGAALDLNASGAVNVNFDDTANSVQGFVGTTGLSTAGWGSLSNHGASIYTNSTVRGGISAAGNWTINAPGSGTTLNVSSIDGQWSVRQLSGTVEAGSYISGDDYILGTASADDVVIRANGTARIRIGAAGNVSINAPSSGIALTATGTASAATEVQRWTDGTRHAHLYISNSGTGLDVQFGSSAGLLLYSNTGTNYLLLGTGLQVGAPSGGDKGAGTLNTAGAIYQNNVPVSSLPAVTSTSTTLAAGQAHYITGNATLPALAAGEWVSIINNSGSAITISESSGYTTYWTASGASVSSFTLAARGRMFAEGIGSSTMYVSGDITSAS